jgi:hypothetical protein
MIFGGSIIKYYHNAEPGTSYIYLMDLSDNRGLVQFSTGIPDLY